LREALVVRQLKEGEQRLWEEMMRGVRPLAAPRPPGKRRTAAPSPTMPPLPLPPQAPAAAAPEPPPPATVPDFFPVVRRPPPVTVRALLPQMPIGQRLPGLDDTSWRALSTGRMRPQRRLDLHGATAQAAFERLRGFLLQAASERLRCVEVITGAGSGEEGGILRRELPHWLSRPDLRPLILAAAHPHAANRGSVRLLLRRR
jgi:DNA-nicking Smr family endonuclease